MTIRNQEIFDKEAPAGFDGVFDWDYLIPAVQKATGRRIEPMDIDCHIEVNGQHLIFETKRRNASIPNGQKKALLELWAKGDHTVIFMWGKSEPVRLEVFYPSGHRIQHSWNDLITMDGEKHDSVGCQFVSNIVYRWASWATKKRRSSFQYNGKV